MPLKEGILSIASHGYPTDFSEIILLEIFIKQIEEHFFGVKSFNKIIRI